MEIVKPYCVSSINDISTLNQKIETVKALLWSNEYGLLKIQINIIGNKYEFNWNQKFYEYEPYRCFPCCEQPEYTWIIAQDPHFCIKEKRDLFQRDIPFPFKLTIYHNPMLLVLKQGFCYVSATESQLEISLSSWKLKYSLQTQKSEKDSDTTEFITGEDDEEETISHTDEGSNSSILNIQSILKDLNSFESPSIRSKLKKKDKTHESLSEEENDDDDDSDLSQHLEEDLSEKEQIEENIILEDEILEDETDLGIYNQESDSEGDDMDEEIDEDDDEEIVSDADVDQVDNINQLDYSDSEMGLDLNGIFSSLKSKKKKGTK